MAYSRRRKGGISADEALRRMIWLATADFGATPPWKKRKRGRKK